MAQTRTAYAQIDDSEIDAESPITESLMTRLRDQWFASLCDAGSGASTTERVALPERAKTTDVDTTKFLRPDGAGGVVFAVPPSSAPTTGQVLTATAGATAGAVGTYAFVLCSPGTSFGGVVSGSSLTPTNAAGGVGPGSLSGTWRCMGRVEGGGSLSERSTLFLRIS